MDFPEARAHVLALLIKCPYEPNPADCQLHVLRNNSLQEKIEFSKRLSEMESMHIIAVHKKCLSQKEGKRSLKD